MDLRDLMKILPKVKVLCVSYASQLELHSLVTVTIPSTLITIIRIYLSEKSSMILSFYERNSQS